MWTRTNGLFEALTGADLSQFVLLSFAMRYQLNIRARRRGLAEPSHYQPWVDWTIAALQRTLGHEHDPAALPPPKLVRNEIFGLDKYLRNVTPADHEAAEETEGRKDVANIKKWLALRYGDNEFQPIDLDQARRSPQP